MNFEQIKSYLDYESEDETWESYNVKKDIMIQVKSQRDNFWSTAEYFQVIHDEDETILVIHLERYPEDPNNHPINADIKVQIFRREV